MWTQPFCWVARVGRTEVVVVTWDCATDTNPGLAGVVLGTQVPISAYGPVWFDRIRAHAIGRIAYPPKVTLAPGLTEDRVRTHAEPALTGVGPRTGVAIVTRNPVGHCQV